jgi:hypothetical protein
MSCPAPEQLGLYQLNLLPARERLILGKHVRECPHCRRELETFARKEDKPSLLERLRQVEGIIEATFLPAPRLQALSLRGTPPALQRFRAGKVEIHISIQPGHTRGTRTVMGRLLSRDEAVSPSPDIEAWLMQNEEAWAAPVEGGVFTFKETPPGIYSLGIEWDEQAIIVQEVKVT